MSLSQGLQAFVPVAVLHASAAGATRRGRRTLWIACVIAVPLSVWAGMFFARAARTAGIEAILAMAAIAVTIALRSAVFSRAATVDRDSVPLQLAVAAAAVLYIVRQEMETSVLVRAALELRTAPALSSILAGVGVAMAATGALTLLTHHVQRPVRERAAVLTGAAFISLLTIYAFHELSEARWLPFSDILHQATEPYGPDGLYGRWGSLLLMVAPVAAFVPSRDR